MYATICRKRYKLSCRKLKQSMGYCTDPELKNKQIVISSKIRNQGTLLEIVIHEALHAANWFATSEEWVTQTATDIAKLLVRLGVSVDVKAVKQKLQPKRKPIKQNQ